MTSTASAVTTAAQTLSDAQKEAYLRYLDYTIYRGQLGRLVDNEVISPTVWYIAVVALLILGYLMGSLNFAVIISKLKFKEDIRTKGSGNAGATNMTRTYGKAAGIMTLLCDIFKAVIPVLAARLFLGDIMGYAVGLMCALGHAFPCYYGFKGGKCVAVTAAIILVMEPLMFLLLVVIFVATVAATKYISVGSIFSALIYPVLLSNIVSSRFGFLHAGLFFAILNSLLVIYLHRKNMKRLLDGKENKFTLKKKKDGEKN